MLLKSVLSLLLPLAAGFVPAAVQQRAPQAACPRAAAVVQMTASQPLGRRAALASLLALGLAPQVAEASGGATAGKYTTIPIAKRRYFGRVKQGVYEFLELGAEVKKGNLDSIEVTGFFSQTLKIQSKRKKSKCIASDSCEVQDKFSSRFEDMKLSMFLLGNAFRMDSGKPPEKVKQVKEAKAFFAQVEKLESAAKAGDKKQTAVRYAAAIEALEAYLNDVELPPTEDAMYKTEADLEVQSLCQGSFCI